MNQKWHKVKAYIEQVDSYCSYAAIGEICHEFDQHEMAQAAFLKINKVDDRIDCLIQFSYWDPAIEQIFQNKREELRADDVLNDPSWPKWAKEKFRKRL